MKRTLALLILLIPSLSLIAQEARRIVFDQETFDFGTISDAGGPATHRFNFTNQSDRPVKILAVRASCGCTTPGWSNEPIPPGKTGFVKASYDPKGRPGHFNKSLTVTTDLDSSPIVLYIKGHVSSADTPPSHDFPVENGGLRFKGNSFNMGKVFLKDEFATKGFVVYNDSESDITFKEHIAPPFIRVQVEPAVLKPGESGVVRIGYNGKQKNMYGFQSDNIQLHTDDPDSPVKSFTVYATLEDYFAPMSPEELARAPRLELELSQFDFGNIEGVATREVTITNSGKNELHLKSVQPNCACIQALPSANAIKPGKSETLKIVFDPQDRKGTQQKAVYIYSDDPRKPVQRIIFTAYVR